MNRTKSFLKIWVLALALLFAVALAFAVTGAAYNASRKADGSLSMANGIVIDYSGFGKAQDGEWQNEQTTTFKLFTDRAIVPGDTVSLNSAAIKKGTDSIDFYARIKFEYKFYDALDSDITTAVGNEYTNFISTPAFNSAWVNGNNNDGWFYYATGTTLNTLPASFVNIFSSSAINVELNVAGFNHEGGGYKFTDANSNEITIAKVEAILTLEAVQTTGSTWEIVHYTDAAGVVYMPNGDNTWTLTDGTALSNNSSSSTATYSARIYTSSYSYTVLSQINNQDVVAIADNAFLNASQLTEITIPTTVATIGTNAFTGTGLSTITIEKDDAVVSGIETAGIPTASVLNVPGAVVGDYELTNLASGGVEIRGLPSVGLKYQWNTLDGYSVNVGTCTDTDIIIQSTYNDGIHGELFVKGIEDYAFKDCINLTSIRIPDSVIGIGNNAFEGCTSLTSITIPNSVEMICCSAFEGCTSLTSITIPNSVTIIDSSAFWGCTGLTSITIPSSVTIINTYTFMYCTGLTSITLSSTVTRIDNQAFYDCVNLTSITIPNSVTSIRDNAFYGCSGLVSIVINSSIIAALNSSNSHLLDNATTVYVLEGLTVGDYIGNWGHTATSDKAGYVKYVKNS